MIAAVASAVVSFFVGKLTRWVAEYLLRVVHGRPGSATANGGKVVGSRLRLRWHVSKHNPDSGRLAGTRMLTTHPRRTWLDRSGYAKSVATFASTSSISAAGSVSTLRPWRAAKSRTRG